jgi:hypothetical protein
VISIQYSSKPTKKIESVTTTSKRYISDVPEFTTDQTRRRHDGLVSSDAPESTRLRRRGRNKFGKQRDDSLAQLAGRWHRDMGKQ